MDDVTGVLNAANAAVKLVGTVSRVAPGLQNAAQGFNRSRVNQQGEQIPQEAIPFDNEQERRAYEKVNMVLRNIGDRLVKAGLVDEAALGRALTAVTQHVEVQLFSVENNKLFQSLANRLNDAQLVTSVFTTIYFLGFLSSELQSSLPNYKATYIPVGQRMIQQMFKVALGLDAFKDNLSANLAAYKTLATTAGMLKPLDLDVTIFRNFPSFGLSKYSGKSYSDTTYFKKAYSNLVTWFNENGFPQPLQGRDVGSIRDWAFLAGDTNTRNFEVERADKHIGENFGRVLYWLLCMASRLNEGSAVIVYHQQHIQLVRWLDTRFGYRVLNAATDLNMIPHSQMKPKHRAIFNSWLIIMPSHSALQKRKETAAALAAQGVDAQAVMNAVHQVNNPSIATDGPSNVAVPVRIPAPARASIVPNAAAATPNLAQSPPQQQQQTNTSAADTNSVMADPILSHFAAKQAEQRVSDYEPSAPSAHEDDVGTVISSEGNVHGNQPMLPQAERSSRVGMNRQSSPRPIDDDDDLYVSSVADYPGSTRSALPSATPIGLRTNSAGLMDRFKQMGSANMADAQTVPTHPPHNMNMNMNMNMNIQSGLPSRVQPNAPQRPYASVSHSPSAAEGAPPAYPGHTQSVNEHPSPSQNPAGRAAADLLARGNSVSRRPVGAPPLRQPSIGSVAELQAMGATMSGPAELSAEMPTASERSNNAYAAPAHSAATITSRRSSAGAASIATTTAPTKAKRVAPPPPKVIQAVAKHDFEPEDDDDGEELAFCAGDLIEITRKTKELEEDGWCQARIKGTFKVALAPLEYLEEIPEPKKRAPPAPKAAPAPAVASPAQETASEITEPEGEVESPRGLDPPLSISEVSADPPAQTRTERAATTSEPSSIDPLSPAREPHMQSPPTFLPHPGVMPGKGRGRDSRDNASSARDVSPMISPQPQSPPTLATEETITPHSYQSPPPPVPPSEEAPPSPVSTHSLPVQPPPGPPPQQQSLTRSPSGPPAPAHAHNIPAPTSAQVNRLQQRRTSGSPTAHMPGPTYRPNGSTHDFYHPIEPGLGGTAFTAHTNPNPPATFVPYSAIPIAFVPSGSQVPPLGSLNTTQRRPLANRPQVTNVTQDLSTALDVSYTNNSVNQNQTQKQNVLDLSGANISLFNDNSTHQQQQNNEYDNNNYASYSSPATDYVVVEPVAYSPSMASPLAALAPGGNTTSMDYFDQTTVTTGVSPLAGLMVQPIDDKSPAVVESTTVTDTDVYVDAQGDVAVDTTTITDTEVYSGGSYVDDTSCYQSYVETDYSDLI